jgi:hypothetical protein
MQQRPEGLVGRGIEGHQRGVRVGRESLQHREATLVEGLTGRAYSLIGAAQVVRNRGSQLGLGTGKEALPTR